MKKKIITIITAAACCFGAVPATASSGANFSVATYNNKLIVSLSDKTESVKELDNFITETAGNHILLTKTADYFYPGRSGAVELIALDEKGKYHLYYTSLTKASFTVSDGFDLDALKAEMETNGISAEITADSSNNYVIKDAATSEYTPANYQKLIGLLEQTDEVTLIEHVYSVAEDTANYCTDPVLLFSSDVTPESIMNKYALDLEIINSKIYQHGDKTVAIRLNSKDLAADYSELKRLTENEDCMLSCAVTELALLNMTKYNCREVVYEKGAPAKIILKGDANCDGKATVADSVAILQHIANRDKYGLSPQGLVNADVDRSAGVTANDALALQRQDAERDDWQWHSTPNKAFYKSSIDYTMSHEGFKDDIWSTIKGGYAGVITSTDELSAYLSKICKDEKTAEYTAKYGDEFFAQNVLFLNTVLQSMSAHPCLVIDSIDLGSDITVNAVWNYPEVGEAVMSVLIGAVEFSKDAYKGQPVVWTCNDDTAVPAPARTKYLSSSARTDWYYDTGSDMNPEVWDMLVKRNYSAVITSSAELEEYLSKVFSKDVVDEYLKFYEGYFEHCVILMNCQLQTSGGSCRLNVKGTELSNDSSAIIVTSAWDTSDADVDMLSVCFQQVKVQKNDYDGQTVNWIIS
ncbi:MAG: dockerin type I repeat-containing protein [Ruminococcus sp.]|nr:dockerin type I repeat-containing protein [Ruminococcus sp.]